MAYRRGLAQGAEYEMIVYWFIMYEVEVLNDVSRCQVEESYLLTQYMKLMTTGPPDYHMFLCFMGDSWKENLSGSVNHTDTSSCP